MAAFQFTLILAVVLGIAEMLTLTFIFLGFSCGMFAVSLVQYLSGSYSLNRDLILFVGISTLFVVILRKIFKKKTDQTRLEQDDINQY